MAPARFKVAFTASADLTEKLERLEASRFGKTKRPMCKAHNGCMAELDYGKEKMDRFRCSVDRVREPQADYGMRPDTFAWRLGATA